MGIQSLSSLFENSRTLSGTKEQGHSREVIFIFLYILF